MESSEQRRDDPGSMLRAAREAQGVSAREMADRLNWMPTYVDAIEENQFEVLRGRAFVRGYLRTYGKMLGLAEADLLAALDAMGIEDEKPVTSSRSTLEVPVWQRPGVGIGLGIAAALSLILVLWLWQGEDEELVVASPVETPRQDPNELEDLVVQASTEDTATAVRGAPPEHVGDAVAETESPPLAELEGLDSARDEAVVPEVGPEVVPEAGPEVGPELDAEVLAGSEEDTRRVQTEPELAPVAAPAPTVAVNATGDLSFRFSGDCWVEVRDATEKLIYADLRRDGDELTLAGEAPFTILVGDARRVDLRYQGEPFEIATRPGRVIAKFTVGE